MVNPHTTSPAFIPAHADGALCGVGVKQKGQTLLEVIVAAVFVLPFLLLLTQVIPGFIKANQKTEEASRCTFLAEQKIEEIKSLIKRPTAGFLSNYSATAESFSGQDWQYKFRIQDVSPLTGLKEIKVAVWKDFNQNSLIDNSEYSVVLDTVVSKRD